MKMKYPLYRFARYLITFFMKCFYRVEYVGKENIPINGGCLLVGNHKSNLDCLLVISSTKRTVRFLAKIELMEKAGWLFKRMGIIPVDRQKKNKEACLYAEEELENDEVIGIFPEGTFNKSPYIILPFKYGAVKMALDTNKPIIPFAIIGDYKLFRKSVKIVFGKQLYIKNKDDLKKENIMLMNKVIKLLKEENEK